MSSESIGEIIGGTDSGGGIPIADDESRAGLAGGGGASAADSLWLSNLDLGNFIFGVFAVSKVSFVSFMWFIYYLAGTRISGYYWATWFSAVLAVYIAWGPVAVTWVLMYTGRSWAETWFFYASLISIFGPLVGYFVPITILILAYNERKDTGLVYSHKAHFWLGWVLAIMITVFTIMFELAFLPGIRVWYDLKQNPDLALNNGDSDEADLDDGPLTFDNDPDEEDPDDAITTFMAKFNINI